MTFSREVINTTMLQIIFKYKHKFFFICILFKIITVKIYFVVKIQQIPFWKHRNSKQIYASWEVTPALISIFSKLYAYINDFDLLCQKFTCFLLSTGKVDVILQHSNVLLLVCVRVCVCVCVCVWHHGANEKIRNKNHKIPAFNVIALGIIWIFADSTLLCNLQKWGRWL